MSKLWECMSLEQEFTSIKRSKHAYFNLEEGIINESEESLCELVAETN